MEFSWKILILIVTASLALQYAVMRSLHTMPKHCTGTSLPDRLQKSFCKNSSVRTEGRITFPKKHILLFSQTRSGSSFAGQLFNQQPDIFYMYEPLYHVQQVFTNAITQHKQTMDTALQGSYRDLLLNLYTCNLNFLENYIQPRPKNHMTSSLFRRGASHALSSPPVCLNQGGQHKRNCLNLNLTLASMACQSRSHVAIKTVRISLLKDLRTLIEDPRLNLKIVHLVRDPRAIQASRMTAFGYYYNAWKVWNKTNKQPRNIDLSSISKMCQDMEYSALIGLQGPRWLRGRYLLLRYEDLAMNPEVKAREIYRFLGLDIDANVIKWIAQNTNSTKPHPSHYSTSRSSKTTQQRWRLRLSFDIVKTMQSICKTSFALLGYRNVQSATELTNLTLSLVEPREF